MWEKPNRFQDIDTADKCGPTGSLKLLQSSALVNLYSIREYFVVQLIKTEVLTFALGK